MAEIGWGALGFTFGTQTQVSLALDIFRQSPFVLFYTPFFPIYKVLKFPSKIHLSRMCSTHIPNSVVDDRGWRVYAELTQLLCLHCRAITGDREYQVNSAK